MTRRSALFSGLAVLLVLLGGQVVGTWYQRPTTGITTASNGAGVKPSGSPTPSPTASPRPSGSVPKPTATPSRKPTGNGPAAMGVRLVTGSRGVALTFDDGPHPEYTPKILDILKAQHVHAVFCVVGTEVRKFPHLVARIAREGHTLCNHSWHHEMNLGSQAPAKIRTNLQRTNDEIRRAAPGVAIPYFRQPGGKWTRTGVRVAGEFGMVSLGWTVDPSDWERPASRTIRSRVLSQSYPGAVVLMHDGGGDRSHTVSACRTLIPALKQRYRVIRLG